MEQEARIKPQDKCLIGVGYNMCTDINFRAVEMINLLEPHILELGELVP